MALLGTAAGTHVKRCMEEGPDAAGAIESASLPCAHTAVRTSKYQDRDLPSPLTRNRSLNDSPHVHMPVAQQCGDLGK